MSAASPSPHSSAQATSSVDPAAVLAALPFPVLVIGAADEVAEANAAAETFFATSRRRIWARPLTALLPPQSALVALVGEVRRHQRPMTAHGLDLSTPLAGHHPAVDASVAPLGEPDGRLVITLVERAIATMMERQMTHRSAARALTGLAAVLAHEIKNPLSGIRGAAQLLESDAGEEERALAGLICAETDRICRLVDRMQAFGADGAEEHARVNIHEVLSHVRQLAEAGFAKGIPIAELYDPSLPEVAGHRDRLIQAFLNLVKNAAEAVGDGPDARIRLTTSFRPGLVRQSAGSRGRESLPLIIAIEDNGPGVPESLRSHIFDPFVTAKPGGSGLGLALVAKIVEEHAGAVELDQRPGRTIFRVSLPIEERSA
jgi:two-component system nitrogen regulation sensor histidine kinase GlnL